MSQPTTSAGSASSEPAAEPSQTSPTPSGPQAGIVNRPPEHMLAFALTVAGPNPRASLEQIRTIVHAELESSLDRLGDPGEPPAETGELGYEPDYDRAHLTITLGLSSSAFDKLGVSADDRPADLVPIPWDKLGDAPDIADSGDLVFQVCADSAFITEHVLRRIEHTLGNQVHVVWAHTGVQRYSSRAGRTARHEGRAWIGFLDGTSNLNPRRDPADYALTFVNPDPAVVATYPKTPNSGQPGAYGPTNQPQFPSDLRGHPGHEPAWTKDGSYLAVRVSENDLAAWDTQALSCQEQTIGRQKVSGVILDLLGHEDARADDPPAFANDQTLSAVALDAHIRKANPRGAEDLARRIFRRGYPLYEASDRGTIRRGLLFVSYARTLSTQFEFITRAWTTNPNFPHPGAGVDKLRQFDQHVLAGGYYFVPPLDDAAQAWSWHIPAATP